jgi:N-sulfoglucosamine sulfohydrolase
MIDAEARRPNLLLITCHDLGRYLGCYGQATVRTPNLDALARDGVRFGRAFCTAPQCSPSRASLVTGRYPHSNGVMGLSHDDFGWALHPGERHLGGFLREAGYRASLVGVAHDLDLAAAAPIDDAVLGGHGDRVSDAAIARLDAFAADERPFYLHLGYGEPHRRAATHPDYRGFVGDYMQPDDALGVAVPGYVLDEPSARAEIAELQGAVHYVDGQIGRVLDHLARLGLADNTLVLFTTDHGVALPRAKMSLYDPGLETALLVRLPSRGWAGGRTHDQLISNVDVLPTLLELLGVDIPPAVQGRSFLGLLDGRPYRARREIFGELTYHTYYDPRRCVRTATHKLMLNFGTAPAFMDPTQSWRRRTSTVVPANPAGATAPPVELYDIADDPLEHANLAGAAGAADVRRDLLSRLRAWMRETDDPLLHGAVAPPMHRRAMDALASADAP